ncbi:hypothetical protein RHGRI_020585 [Rhododendron griersonianum]|uniref:Uncharacterized protein n=1 Tax=Rhododendron griersonianum TaxID=479676 RepID=A0AAV6JM63_9ERIC|nr:hypothetical protein RHGRI_020585 [Rhododendron griersonianum]
MEKSMRITRRSLCCHLALLDGVDYARIRGIHGGRSTEMIETGISLRRQLYSNKDNILMQII